MSIVILIDMIQLIDYNNISYKIGNILRNLFNFYIEFNHTNQAYGFITILKHQFFI